ncbi:MAG: hypothetical protein LBH87_02285 [Coriobacteriales bacterium]|jgi:hypothetical protein|nr:hypothetical protein [Coriobacteriales bacterium]
MGDLNKGRLRSIAGVNFMIITFTVIWAVFMIVGFGIIPFSVVALIVLIAYSVFLYVAMVPTMRSIRTLPNAPIDNNTGQAGRRIGRRFRIIFGVEILCGAAVIVVCNIIGAYEYISPAIAVFVGAHFILLSPLFHIRWYIPSGIIVILVSAAAILLIALGIWDSLAIGTSCLVTALVTASIASYLLWLVRRGIKKLKMQAANSS